MDGTPYALPILESTAEVAVPIPENSTLINQTSMAIDKNDRPVVASWWAPGTPQQDYTRQYMLAYYDGSAWQTSQITHRPSESMQDDSTVRDLGRPLVMVDDDNRVIVVMRYDQRNDVVTVGYSEDRQNWNLVDLTTDPLGDWEPTYDAALWNRENKLHLFYQPIDGSTSTPISVLEWDAKAFFLGLAGAPLELQVNRTTGAVTIANPADGERAISAYSIGSAGGQLSPSGWQSLHDQSIAGWAETQALTTALAESNGGGSLPIPGSGSVALGEAYAGQPIAFGVDAPGDLTFQYTVDGTERTGNVTYAGESLNNLALFVDPNTGYARLENTSPFPVSIDGYTIESATDSLDLADWLSLDQQDADNGQWSEANASEHRLSELQTAGETLLASGDSFYLGQLFDAVGGEPDLVFQFLIADQNNATTGVVVYASFGLPGDYNDDGVVDAADYTVWRDHLGTTATLPNDTTPGSVQPIDYLVWKSNFGRSLAGGSASAAEAVPEPSAQMLMATIAFVGVLRVVAQPALRQGFCSAT
jgi:BNR repeat-containing family member